MMDHARLKVCEIATAVGISSEYVHNIWHQRLKMTAVLKMVAAIDN